jgi:hypothetical protein
MADLRDSMSHARLNQHRSDSAAQAENLAQKKTTTARWARRR